jgi:hypothetical protein
VEEMDGASTSRRAKMDAAVSARRSTSSIFRDLEGRRYATTATTRPSIRYFTMRVRVSCTSNEELIVFYVLVYPYKKISQRK